MLMLACKFSTHITYEKVTIVATEIGSDKNATCYE